MTPEQAAELREPFPPHMIGKLPRVTCRDCSDKNTTCQRHKKSKCPVCEAYISEAHIHLDFVGHAGATDRLLKVDPEWTWEPVAFDADGAPLVKRDGKEARLWIRLTIAGVSRLGVGIVETGKFELEKQLISDAIRNAAMRFGVALDLWSKEDLWEQSPEGVDATTGEIVAGGAAGDTPPPASTAGNSGAPATTTKQATEKQRKLIGVLVDRTGLVPPEWPLPDVLPMSEASRIIDWLQDQPAEPKADRVETLRADAEEAQQEFAS